MKLRCIKCEGQYATRDCHIKQKIQELICINCKEKGHLAAWRGCKAFPTINRYKDKRNAQVTLKSPEPPTEKELKKAPSKPKENQDNSIQQYKISKKISQL